MEKITNRSFDKIYSIIEIMMPLLNCNYTTAFLILKNTQTYKAILEGDRATLYQSAACCVEDIGRELYCMDNSYATYFSNERINNAIDVAREYNQLLMQKYSVI